MRISKSKRISSDCDSGGNIVIAHATCISKELRPVPALVRVQVPMPKFPVPSAKWQVADQPERGRNPYTRCLQSCNLCGGPKPPPGKRQWNKMKDSQLIYPTVRLGCDPWAPGLWRTGPKGVGGGNEHLESSSHANNDNDTPRGYRDCLGAEEPRDQEIGERRKANQQRDEKGRWGGDGTFGCPVAGWVCVSPCHRHRHRTIVDKCWKNKF
uniref:HDC14023 n=1 Tax=Drosophila melanogaster TaxID=7227 RepID=Q6IJX1_DROME|nr:TPA_inf: HDC14023 [Drosophila melanogaster]